VVAGASTDQLSWHGEPGRGSRTTWVWRIGLRQLPRCEHGASTDFVVAILGVLTAGAAYLLMDLAVL
jgi:hypothetical protein